MLVDVTGNINRSSQIMPLCCNGNAARGNAGLFRYPGTSMIPDVPYYNHFISHNVTSIDRAYPTNVLAYNNHVCAGCSLSIEYVIYVYININ